MMHFTSKSVIAAIAALVAIGVAFGNLTDAEAKAVMGFVVIAAAAFNPTHRPKS